MKRLKGIEGNLAGEGSIQGGWLIVDKNAEVTHLGLENVGTPFERDSVLSAVKTMLETCVQAA